MDFGPHLSAIQKETPNLSKDLMTWRIVDVGDADDYSFTYLGTNLQEVR